MRQIGSEQAALCPADALAHRSRRSASDRGGFLCGKPLDNHEQKAGGVFRVECGERVPHRLMLGE